MSAVYYTLLPEQGAAEWGLKFIVGCKMKNVVAVGWWEKQDFLQEKKCRETRKKRTDWYLDEIKHQLKHQLKQFKETCMIKCIQLHFYSSDPQWMYIMSQIAV